MHHVGGIHAGAALAGTAWLCAFTVVALVGPRARTPRASRPRPSSSPAASSPSRCSWWPARRRPCGAAPTTCSSCRTGSAAGRRSRSSGRSRCTSPSGSAATPRRRGDRVDWHVWVLALLTASVASPWLRLRRVPVTVERPSSHAAIVRFDHGVTPAFASAVGISRSPLREWHAFATVTTPGRPGYRLLISRAGDWTGRFIDDPPSHVWVRGTPVSAPMAKVALLYERVVYVVTGSGIGRASGRSWPTRVPARLVWSTREPAGHLRRRARRRGGGRAARRGHLGHDAATASRTSSRSPATRCPRLRRRGRLRGEQQAHDAAPRPRPRAARASRPSGRSGTPEPQRGDRPRATSVGWVESWADGRTAAGWCPSRRAAATCASCSAARAPTSPR